MRTALALAALWAALALGLAGLGLVGWALYERLAAAWTPVQAALALGVFLLVLAGGLAWWTRRLVQ